MTSDFSDVISGVLNADIADSINAADRPMQ